MNKKEGSNKGAGSRPSSKKPSRGSTTSSKPKPAMPKRAQGVKKDKIK